MKASTRRKWKIYTRSPLFIALIALISTAIGSFITYRLTLNSQITVSDRQQRQILYSRLVGGQALFEQMQANKVSNEIIANYYDVMWEKEGRPKKSFSRDKADYHNLQSERLNTEVAKEFKNIFETVGLIQAVFPKTDKLDELSKKVLDFKSLNYDKISDAKSDEDLFNRTTALKNRSLDDITNIYGKPVTELADYLLIQMKELN